MHFPKFISAVSSVRIGTEGKFGEEVRISKEMIKSEFLIKNVESVASPPELGLTSTRRFGERTDEAEVSVMSPHTSHLTAFPLCSKN